MSDSGTNARPPVPWPEMWGGVECTVNRVGQHYFDQIERSGHVWRLADLDRFAALGVRALRYPVLWERTAPDGLAHVDWRWPDERLGRLRELGIRPIVGLLHHGSGPASTSLVDPAFPARFAEYARAVAERYPWVEEWTPVNEPLTTARFSGLYGHWYPHGCDPHTFVRALLNQIEGIRQAMAAIRTVNPGARLVQTEDLGKTHSTKALAYQAAFENHRRWLTVDLLCGRVVRGHPLWSYLCDVGATAWELAALADAPCPPDVVGLNHYLTSERFLDERLECYPPHTHGGNGRHRYADVEAVRVCAEGLDGPRALLAEAWERYRLPIAVTEAHVGCTREQQLRWLAEVWDAATSLRDTGADVRAVTVWSLLGAHDWPSLLTRVDGHYESGVFDLRAPAPRPTALASMVRDLATRGRHDHPVLEHHGWWRDAARLLYPPVRVGRTACAQRAAGAAPASSRRARPVLVTGATGTLGRAFARACEERGLSYRLVTRQELDITDERSVTQALEAHVPWAVVNAAGYVRVDHAERDIERCFRENAHGPALLADHCTRRGIALLTVSSDLVFDGGKGAPYCESDQPAPLNVYGASKAEAERRVLAAMPAALVVRTSAFFGPSDEHNFAAVALRALSAGVPFVVADDAVVSPTYVPDLVHAALDLLIDGERGIWHLANAGSATWAELARRVAELTGLDAGLVEGRPTDALGLTAPRPRFSVLTSERGHLLPPLDSALERFIKSRAWASEVVTATR